MPRTESNPIELGTLGARTSSCRTRMAVCTGSRISSGQPALLVAFISNRCPFVILIREELARIGRDYADQGLAIVAINSQRCRGASRGDTCADRPRRCASKATPSPTSRTRTSPSPRPMAPPARRTSSSMMPTARLAYHGQFDDARPGNGKPVTGADLRDAVDAVLAGERPQRASPVDRLQHQVAGGQRAGRVRPSPPEAAGRAGPRPPSTIERDARLPTCRHCAEKACPPDRPRRPMSW